MDETRVADAVEALRKPGVTIEVRICDVADKEGLSATLLDCAQTLPPIRGVIQGAMVLKVRLGILSLPAWRKKKKAFS